MRSKLLFLVLIAASGFLSGCQQFRISGEVFDRYDGTVLKVSTSADVLADAYKPDSEMLSQSESVVAA